MQSTLTDLRTDYAELVERGALPPSALQALNGALANLERYDTCLAETCREYRIWQLLLGWNKGLGFFLLTLAIVIYNFIRYSLTQTVSAFREEEERSGYTPSLKDYFTPNLFGIYPDTGTTWRHKLAGVIGLSPTRLHVILRTLFFLATLAFIVNLLEVLFTVVKLRP